MAVSEERVRELHERLEREAEAGGYHLNPDAEFTRDLVEGLLVNIDRYGYPSCPCRLAEGEREPDRDIVCPCYYRDPDLDEYGCCYCALYVSSEVAAGRAEARSIPERRPPEEEREPGEPGSPPSGAGLPYPVWRCEVCGYLCARESPPEVCPVCRARRDRFSRFM